MPACVGRDLLVHARGSGERGVSRALVRAAVDFARERGARAVEGYPMTTKNVILEELHVGTIGVFADAGFTGGQSADSATRRAAHRLLTDSTPPSSLIVGAGEDMPLPATSPRACAGSGMSCDTPPTREEGGVESVRSRCAARRVGSVRTDLR